MNKIWIYLIVFTTVIAVCFLWWIFYPMFRVIEVNDGLPIEITMPDKNNQIQDIRFANLDTYGTDKAANNIEEETFVASMNTQESTKSTEQLNDIQNPTSEINNTIEQANIIKESGTTPVIGVGGHSASGSVKIIKQGSKQYIRYQNFSTTDGPELRVYLSRDLAAKDYVDLGLRKGTRGNINYSIPDHIDINDYKYVLHWCRPFRVLFNYADIEEIKDF